jgi:hypothetical protein
MSSGIKAAVVWLFTIPLFVPICSMSAAAQGLGTVTGVGAGGACPSGRGFDPGMTCFPATLSGCSAADELQFVYGVEKPTGPPAGTIVILEGNGAAWQLRRQV